jgi:hypothetical protein
MSSAAGNQSGDLARQKDALRRDRHALREIVRDRRTCEATGVLLEVEDAVAMIVSVSPGVSRLAVVSGAHWDNGDGPLSAADPAVDPDVLDGRTLFPSGATSTRSIRVGARPDSSPQSPGRRARGTGLVPQPRPQEPGSTGVVPHV